MKTNLDFKKCTLDDLDVLVTISKETFIDAFEKDNNPDDFKNYINTAFSKQTITSELINQKSHFYLVYSKSILIGYFKLNFGDAQNETFKSTSIELERIYVITHFQSKGYGKHILYYIISIARKEKVDSLWLGVWQKNKSAIKFYERLGFTKFGAHPYYIGQDKQTDWLMKLELH